MALLVLTANFPDHRKMLAAGPNACWLWVRGLAWCKRFPNSHGSIPKNTIAGVAAGIWSPARLRKLCETLVLVGLWHDDEGAFRIHDYEQYALPALLSADTDAPTGDDPGAVPTVVAELTTLSAKRSAAGKSGALSRWQNGNRDGKGGDVANGKTDGKTPALPSSLPSDPSDSALNLTHPPYLPSGSEGKDSAADLFQGGARSKSNGKRNGKPATDAGPTWDAYAAAYEVRYEALPLRDAKANALLRQILKRLPLDEAPGVVAHYVRSNNEYYVRRGHELQHLLADVQKLRTEWLTGRHGTAAAAHRIDKTADRGERYAEMMAELEAEDAARAAGGPSGR